MENNTIIVVKPKGKKLQKNYYNTLKVIHKTFKNPVSIGFIHRTFTTKTTNFYKGYDEFGDFSRALSGLAVHRNDEVVVCFREITDYELTTDDLKESISYNRQNSQPFIVSSFDRDTQDKGELIGLQAAVFVAKGGDMYSPCRAHSQIIDKPSKGSYWYTPAYYFHKLFFNFDVINTLYELFQGQSSDKFRHRSSVLNLYDLCIVTTAGGVLMTGPNWTTDAHGIVYSTDIKKLSTKAVSEQAKFIAMS